MAELKLEWYHCAWLEGPEPERLWGWYVNLAWYLARGEPAQPFPVAELLEARGPQHALEAAKLTRADPDRPVLLAPLPLEYTAPYSPAEVLFMIDGHHTLTRAAQLGRRTVRGVVLSQEQSKAAMLTREELEALIGGAEPWSVLKRFHVEGGYPLVQLRHHHGR
ncbi:hypothetical protein [Calidithermus chliarophilus]|uniref:hypothetical protein n=1 Tax=Calidithermus chliarophilus TaxID=52023 RepID=UPI00041328DF|nr:hypothetical protein [Calidithermus chliarophilus]